MDLDQFRWKNRLLILNTEKVATAQSLSEEFNKNDSGNQDRQLIIIEVNRNQEKLWNKFGFEAGVFQLVLIGKDGGVKQTYDKFVSMQSIYQVIDAMPMRQQEMKGKR